MIVAVLTMTTVPLPAAPSAMDKKACLAVNDKGQDLRAAGKLLAAREQFLSCARDPCPGVVKSDCAKWVGELDADIPTIVVRVTRGGSDVADSRVLVDGEPREFVGKAVALDPGQHTIAVTAEGSKAVEQKVVLATGERNRIVTIDLALATTTTTSTATTAGTSTNDRSRSTPTWAWLAGGVGVLSLGGFTYFAVTGVREVARLDRECAPFCRDADVDSARHRLLYADISLGVSIVALGIAAYGIFSASRTTTTETKTMHANIALLPGGGFAGLRGSF